MAQNDKKLCQSHSISQEAYIMILVFDTQVSWYFFHFFKILIFWFVRGIKGQKNEPKWQKMCLTPYLRNHTSYDCGFSCAIFFFKILIFWVFRGVGVKGQKMIHNYQFQSVTLYILKTVDHIINIFGTQV